MFPDRRQYSRFDLPDGTRAMDESGRLVGRVERAGAGGLQIRLDDGLATKPQVGQHTQLTVMDAQGRTHRLSVEVRFLDSGLMGVRFLSDQSTPS